MSKKKNEWFEWIKAIAIAGIIAVVIRVFFFAPIVVDGPSMLPTLHTGDQMIVSKFTYQIKEPERFDIVVFHATARKDYIKRVIGLQGEHIEYKDETLYVNGQAVEEPFLDERKSQLGEHQVYTYDFKLEELRGEYDRIPEGFILVLGDNRTNSTDSRSLGLISLDQVVGNTSLIYWPFDRIGFVE
ncbi:signal peptidase I [Bacillaceae bacterium S4-13-56]